MMYATRFPVSFILALVLSAALGTPTARAQAIDTAAAAYTEGTLSAQDSQASPDPKEGIATGFDSIWTGSNIPTQPPSGLERVMLSDDKILVVLGVVLIIWFGIMALILRNDRRIGQLETELENHRSDF